MQIRRATAADIDALVPLKAALHELHVAERPDVFSAMGYNQIASWLRDRLRDADAFVWIACDDAEVLGYALAAHRAREATSYSLPREWFEVDEVAVAPQHRRRGIARSLVERVVEHARQTATSVELTAWSFNHDAHAAFAAVGFLPMIVRYELTA